MTVVNQIKAVVFSAKGLSPLFMLECYFVQVYCVEVIYNGNITTVEKRYSEFYDLYRKVCRFLFYQSQAWFLFIL